MEADSSESVPSESVNRVGFIVNQMSGGGLSKSDRLFIEDLREKLVADISYTSPVTGATQCLTDLSQYSELWIVGGDGTLSQVVNRLAALAHEPAPVVHVLPTGTGNDFAFSLGITGSLDAVIKRLRSGATKMVDVGRVEWVDCGRDEWNERSFINAMGIGLDAAVALRAELLKARFGKSAYVIASLVALLKRRRVDASVQFNEERLSSRFLLAAICNGRRAGAGFFLTPDAIIDDRQLDLCLLEDVGLLRALWLLPMVKAGRHRGKEWARLRRLTRGHFLIAGGGTPMHIDGESVSEAVSEVSVKLNDRQVAFRVFN